MYQKKKCTPNNVSFVFISVMMFFFLVLSATVSFADQKPLPLGVQVVLQKVGAFMAEKAYAEAFEVLTRFNARSKKRFNPKIDDPRGYHHPEIYFARGNCHLLLEQYAEAAAAYEKSLARDPTHTGAWLNLAKVRYEQKKPLAAAHCFEKGYAAAPEKNPEHLYFAACAYLMGEKYDHAINLFEKLSHAHPKAVKPSWKENYVHALLAADRSLEALPLIESLTQICTGDKKVQWQEILLSQYLALEQLRKALAFVKQLTRESPTTARWWKAMAHVQLNMGEQKNALCALMIYGYLTPLNREEKRLLADLNLQLGIPAKAAPLYESLAADKPDKNIIKNLAVAYQQQGNGEQALEHLQKFDDSYQEPELLMFQGDLLYAMGKFPQAAKIYRKAAAYSDIKGRAWLMAGYAAWQAEDLAQSRKAFLLAADDPEQETAAREALRQIN